MSSLIPRVVIIGLAASVSPVAIMILITVLFKKHARRNSLVFIAGFTLTLLALGVIGVYVFHLGGSGGTSKVDAYIDLALGVICLAAIPLSITRKKKKEATAVEKDLKVLKAFYLGGFAMIMNSSTLIIFISGLHAISATGLEALDAFLAVVVLTLFTLVTLLIPTAIFFIFPGKSEKVLGSLESWLGKHTKAIGVVILLAFGIYLSIKGIRAII